jgi:Cu/Ag efflux protein CusF
MKTLKLIASLVLVISVMLVSAHAVLAGAKTHDVKGTVVSVDLKEKKITFKTEKGDNQTAPVMDAAAESLKILKAGDKVILTCTDNDKGDHQGISAIRVAPEANE